MQFLTIRFQGEIEPCIDILDQRTLCIMKPGGGTVADARNFGFGAVFGPSSTQEEVYENSVWPTVRSILDVRISENL